MNATNLWKITSEENASLTRDIRVLTVAMGSEDFSGWGKGSFTKSANGWGTIEWDIHGRPWRYSLMIDLRTLWKTSPIDEQKQVNFESKIGNAERTSKH